MYVVLDSRARVNKRAVRGPQQESSQESATTPSAGALCGGVVPTHGRARHRSCRSLRLRGPTPLLLGRIGGGRGGRRTGGCLCDGLDHALHRGFGDGLRVLRFAGADGGLGIWTRVFRRSAARALCGRLAIVRLRLSREAHERKINVRTLQRGGGEQTLGGRPRFFGFWASSVPSPAEPAETTAAAARVFLFFEPLGRPRGRFAGGVGSASTAVRDDDQGCGESRAGGRARSASTALTGFGGLGRRVCGLLDVRHGRCAGGGGARRRRGGGWSG